MKIWKRNAIIAAAVALVCGGMFLNWRLNAKKQTPLPQTLDAEKVMDDACLVLATQPGAVEAAAEAQPERSTAEYFAQLRLSRQESRDGAVELLQETIAYADPDTDLSSSESSLNQIVNLALQEAQLESLVMSKGYTECVAYMTEDGISLAVPAKAEGLTDADVALLTDLITSQSDYTLDQIRIIEVKAD